MLPITDDQGNTIYQYDPNTALVYDMNGYPIGSGGSQAFYDSGTNQIVFSDPTQGGPLVGTVSVPGNAPPADPVAAGIDPGAIVKLASGAMYTYKAVTGPTGTTYTPIPYTGAGSSTILGMSPMMLLGIGALAIVALSPKGKRHAA